MTLKVGQVWSFTPHNGATPFKVRIERVDANGLEVSDPDNPMAPQRAGFSASLWSMMVAGAETEVSEPS